MECELEVTRASLETVKQPVGQDNKRKTLFGLAKVLKPVLKFRYIARNTTLKVTNEHDRISHFWY